MKGEGWVVSIFKKGVGGCERVVLVSSDAGLLGRSLRGRKCCERAVNRYVPALVGSGVTPLFNFPASVSKIRNYFRWNDNCETLKEMRIFAIK